MVYSQQLDALETLICIINNHWNNKRSCSSTHILERRWEFRLIKHCEKNWSECGIYWRGAICIFPFLLFSSNHYKNRHSAFQNSWGNKLTILDDVWILLGMYMLRKAIFIWKWKTRWNAHPRIQKVCVVDYNFRLQLFFAQFICR